MKPISILKASAIFIGFTLYFYLLLFTLLPFTKAHLELNPAMYWFITGYFLFIPVFACAVMLSRIEGNSGPREIATSLNIKPFSGRDWIYAVSGLLLTFLFTGIIFGASALLAKYYGVRPLSTTPWFMEMRPFTGRENLLLLVWLPMFFFNIAGEEILWRGYIQSRLRGKYSWLICSFMWLMFHLPFGLDLLLTLVPVIIIIPYAFTKTRNTLTGIFIHGIFNGPVFIAVASGIIG